MKHARLIGVFSVTACLIIGSVLFLAYEYRSALRDWTYRASRPSLPSAEPYTSSSRPDAQGSTSGTSSSIPKRKLLDVPFTSQAPHANWDDPYQEACEEASVIMTAAYYHGEQGVLDPDEADRRILELIKTEETTYGYGQDITAQEVVELINGTYPDLHASVFAMKTANDLKSWIAKGVPVIVPADGKALPNPNFRNGGPVYHMLVVIGYTETQFITNDPGTRLGKEFLYEEDDLLHAIHDWNGGDVPNGARIGVAVEKAR